MASTFNLSASVSTRVSNAMAVALHLRVVMPLTALIIVGGLAGVHGLTLPPFACLAFSSLVWLIYLLDAEPHVSPEDKTCHPARYIFFQQHAAALKTLQIGLAVSTALSGLVCLSQLQSWPLLAVPCAAISALYITPAMPMLRHVPKIKRMTVSKPIWVAVVWWAGAWAAISPFNTAFELQMMLSGASVALLAKVLMETLIRDVLDVEDDRAEGIRTIAVASMPVAVAAIAAMWIVTLVCIALAYPLLHALVLAGLTGCLPLVVFWPGLEKSRAKDRVDALVVPWYALF